MHNALTAPAAAGKKSRFAGFRNKAAALGTMLMGSMYTAAAWAQSTDVGAAITSEVTNAKDKVNGILIILAAIVGVLLLWAYVKRAR